MRGLLIIPLALPLLIALTGADEAREPLLADNFERPTETALARTLLADGHVTLAEGEGVDGSSAIRVAYVGYPRGSQRVVHRLALPKPVDAATLRFDVKFERGFDFARGGKLHGLGPRRPVTGGNPIRPDGWSARTMFDDGGAVRSYTYHQDQPGQYGAGGERVRDFRFRPDRWHTVELAVRVNDPADAANGSVRLNIDGELIVRHDGLRLRGVDGDDTRITQLLFSTFHGGHTPDWAPRDADGEYATVHALFDNFAVFADNPGP